MKLQELCEVTNTAYVTGEVAALDKKKRKQQDAQFKTTSKTISEAKKKPPVDDSPLAQLKALPQPIGVNGGSYTYWVDVTKTPLKFEASDGSEMSKVSTLEGIKPWLDKHMAEFWQEFLDGDETLDFMIEEGVIRVKKGRTDQQDHETRQRMGESKKVADSGPVGVANPSPEAKKNRKMAQAVVAGYTKHIKTSGLNKSYAKKHRKEMSEESDTYVGRHRAALAEGKNAAGTIKKVGNNQWIAKAEGDNGPYTMKIKLLDHGWKVEDNYDGSYGTIDDAALKAMLNHIGLSMAALKESMNEGMFVVKNKDGVEKRFRDADSVEAKAYKASNSPQAKSKVPSEKFSKAWWEYQEDTSSKEDLTMPWDKIGEYELDADVVDPILKSHGGGRMEDWTRGRQSEIDVKGVPCRAIQLRVQFSFGKEDDMGLSDKDLENGRVSDTQTFIIRRDEKNPKKFVFAGFGN